MTSAHQDTLETAPRPICPYTLLQRACEGAASSDMQGASTAVLVSLVGDTLRWANMGESGFAVLRGGAIVHRSRAQLARFNCPLQLAAKGVDFITQAEVGETPVRDGDIVVVATDGLFDNMFDAELERVVRMGTVLGFSPKNMADIIVGIAYEMSWSKDKDSPFSVGYRNHTGSQRCGGKEDDITVVVAFVVSTQLAAERAWTRCTLYSDSGVAGWVSGYPDLVLGVPQFQEQHDRAIAVVSLTGVSGMITK
ncbi:putative protein phosphatase 2C 23 [Hordeum vulgare]|nr:putative protein phosphatase 2C 23 [Hordeum vulgare]